MNYFFLIFLFLFFIKYKYGGYDKRERDLPINSHIKIKSEILLHTLHRFDPPIKTN